MKIYISGKMSGLDEQYVRAQFARAKEFVEQAGHVAVSPLDNGLNYNDAWEEHMQRDLDMLKECDAILLLDNWVVSRGAMLELQQAMNDHQLILSREYFDVAIEEHLKYIEFKMSLTN